MMELDMNTVEKFELLRSTGKNGQKRNVFRFFDAANDTYRRQAA